MIHERYYRDGNILIKATWEDGTFTVETIKGEPTESQKRIALAYFKRLEQIEQLCF